ncbi:MAG: DMT family transporter, partial [Alphaproteobacteria bacterium]
MSTQSYGRGIALAAAGMLVISPDGLLIRLLDATGPWQLVFWRTAFMALALAVGLAIAYGGRLLPIARALGGGGLLAGIIIGLSNVTFVGAITNTTVANTLVILATLPLFAALFARAILGERVAPRTWAVIAVAFAGMVLIFANSLGGGSLTGDALALLTAALFSLGVVILRRAGNRDMTAALWVGAMVSALIALPLSLAGPSGLSLSGLVVPAGDMAI